MQAAFPKLFIFLGYRLNDPWYQVIQNRCNLVRGVTSHSSDQLNCCTLLVYACRGLEIREDNNPEEFCEMLWLCERKELSQSSNGAFADGRTGVLKKRCEDSEWLRFEACVRKVVGETRDEDG